MIARNRDDLTRIMHVRLVELLAIGLVLVRAVDNVSQVKEERRTGRGLAHIVVSRHRFSDSSLRRVGTLSSIAHRMEQDGTRGRDLVRALLPDHVGQRHDGRSLDGWYRLKVPLNMV